jgi:hypothetical protein
MWAQWDWGQGPTVAGRVTNLFCAWLAWCRFRVVITTWDRTLPTEWGHRMIDSQALTIRCAGRCVRNYLR